MTKKINQRELILEGLIHIVEHKEFSHMAINQLLSKHQELDKRSRAFISHVIIGTLEHLLEMDYIINQFSNIKVKKMKPVIRNVLRSGVYQLKYMDNIPPSAVCNEAVNIVSKRGFKNLTGFVNGILRNIARNLEQLSYPTDLLSYLEVRYSIPVWIIKLWLEDGYFKDFEGNPDWNKIQEVAKALQEKRPLTIRTNLSKIEPKVLKEKLESHGVTVEEHPYLSYAFKLSGLDYLEALEDFKEGNFYVQDVSSMLVAEVLSPEADSVDSVVLDCCAAPGGKALHLADKIRVIEAKRAIGVDTKVSRIPKDDTEISRAPKGDIEISRAFKRDTETNPEESKEPEVSKRTTQVLAWDLTDRKVALIRENIARTGFENIKASKKDATILDKEWVGKADIVLADVPCSGLGILGKKPDLRYNASLEGIEELVQLQQNILTNACAYVKPQGVLIFSTCTINSRENLENVRWLLENFPEFQLVPIWDDLPEKLKEELEKQGKRKQINSSIFDNQQDEIEQVEIEQVEIEQIEIEHIKESTLQLLPGINDCDGFFISKFRKCL